MPPETVNAATEAAKEALLPSTQTMRHLFASGSAIFGGLALSRYVGMKVGPAVQKMMGDKVPVVSGETIARAATFAVLAFGHAMLKDTAIASKPILGIELRSLTFAATAASFASAAGSLIVDVLDKWGGSSKPAVYTRSFVATMTGLPGGHAEAQTEAPIPA